MGMTKPTAPQSAPVRDQPPPQPNAPDPNATAGDLSSWQLTPQRILLLLAVLCFVVAFVGGIQGVNIIALGFALGFAAFLF